MTLLYWFRYTTFTDTAPVQDAACSRYDPVDEEDEGTRDGDNDRTREADEREMDRVYDNVNEGAADRSVAGFLMEDDAECGEGLTCNDQRVCITPMGECSQY